MGISQTVGLNPGDEVPAKTTEEDRLLNLFWNRAELKKEFSNLRDDRDHLIERLQEQEKQTERERKRMRDMEKLLANPDSGYRAIVYFQLRALWGKCHRQLEKFCDQLKKQQQDRERKRQIMEFNQERQKRLQEINGRIVSTKAEADDMKNVIAGFERQRDNLRGFWNYFKRRNMQATVDEHKTKLAAIRSRLEDLFDRRIKIESEPWPEYPGLGISGKRAINVAMLALSQHLFVQLSDGTVANLARTAKHKKVQDVDYGTRSDCEYKMKKIDELANALMSNRNYADELRARTDMLNKQVEFKSNTETVPAATSVARLASAVPGFDPGRTVASIPLEINVLADDYWDIQKLLMK
ncbi:MAG: hypothetical protein KJO54_02445 [Gammaproteobacteria bacterium]|nr:hypothetical protein [Gammaproteobacteria bacterium]NNF61955.1 hypothetical protein [Gammaproteobacteria bacterium]NNM21169.1 hypothetical protein [Gammaproteobacteria bacterium]